MSGETIVKGLGTGGSQNFIQRLMEQIPQRDVAGMIETTRYYTSIHQYSNLIAKGIAEHIGFFKLGMFGIGPFEHTVVLDIYIFSANFQPS